MLLKKQQLDDKTDCEGMSLVTSVPKEKEGVVGRARAAEASTHCSSIVTIVFPWQQSNRWGTVSGSSERPG